MSGSDDGATDITIQADGSILVAGLAGGSLAVAKYDSAGAPVAGFGTGGKLVIPATGDSVDPWGRGGNVGMAVQPDGRIVLAGSTTASGNRAAFVARVTAAGALDPTFGSGGTTTINVDPTGADTARGVALDPSGAIYVGVNRWSDGMLFGLRLTSSGVLDTTWDGDGIRAFAISAEVDPTYHYLGANQPVPATDGGVYFVGSDQAAKAGGGATIPDFASGSADWTPGASGMFGVCLRDVSGATTDGTTWTNDPDHDCADGNSDPWRAIPDTTANPLSKVAYQGAIGTAHAYLRFGMRTAPAQAPGSYVAPLTIEVLAPTA
jgi:uncharacterized delta-60 repeat protein